MEMTVCIDKYRHVRYNLFKWRYELDIVHKVALSLGFACLTGLLAQVRFCLPWTPVPITGQTFAVLLSAILLGKWSGISQCIYAVIGVAGVPWFAGGNGGIGVITGATGGYIIGFIIASFFLGYFVDKYIRSRSFISMLVLMLFANFVLIYGPGLLQLYVWLSFVKGASIGFSELLMIGAAPFIVGDVIKIVAAAAITRGITPKQSYNRELDVEKWKSR
ncbi:biotin transporter BioY [candidate division WOR-3 bacterium]|nr:biotin transporter BioY [candidate division WOR-3 bacterium]